MKMLSRDMKRDEDLKFYSDAASQFRSFNSAWRIRIAHAISTSDEEEAIKVLDHVVDFFVTLATRLREKKSIILSLLVWLCRSGRGLGV
jgi:hypothetical protein